MAWRPGHVASGAVPAHPRPSALVEQAAWDFRLGTGLLREGRFAEAEGALRASLGLRPRDPDALNNLGTALWQQGRMNEAETCYRQAVALRPDDFAIQNNLGNALWRQGRLDEAAPHYERAIAINPASPEAWMNLGVIQADLGQDDRAVASIQHALSLHPHWPEALDNLGSAHARSGRWSTALEYHEQALALAANFPEARRNRALAYLKHGDFTRGWPEYEWRLACRTHQGFSSPLPRWDGRARTGTLILLHAEQGLGDTLQFIRYAEMVKERVDHVIVFCPTPLARLVARCPGVDGVCDRQDQTPAFDVHASLLSLPAILGTTLETIPCRMPYLSVDESTAEFWRARIRALAPANQGRTFRIGVAWQGNPLNRIDRQRSFPLAALEPLARIPGVRLVSLQKGEGLGQIGPLCDQVPVDQIVPPGNDDRDLLDTAAAIGGLDLVVAPDSAVAHLAGGLGAPVWLALPRHPEWRWLAGRDDSPWYPTMKLFRQSAAGDWAGVFEAMASILKTRLTS